jgi:cob(I)alamin adenosyltransferase
VARIYTRGGDRGQTDLTGGARVSKSHPRIAAGGELDELCASLGEARGLLPDLDLQEILGALQRDLFAFGARLADPASSSGSGDERTALTPELVERLEARIDRFEAVLPPLRKFLLPGGVPAAGRLYSARAIARRAERALVALSEREPVEPLVLAYLNRISDLLFVLAREANRRAGAAEETW